MYENPLLAGSATDNLDRGVLLAAVSGLVVNFVEHSIMGFVLTSLATVIYCLVRNRIANIEFFDDDPVASLPKIPGINLSWYAWFCQWFGSHELFYGLLADLAELNREGQENLQRKLAWSLNVSLFLAVCLRTKYKFYSLFWLDRFMR